MAQSAIDGQTDHPRVVRVALFALLSVAVLAVSSIALAQFIWPTGSGALREVSISGLSEEPYSRQFLVADDIPIWLVRLPDGDLRAFWARSPHPRGCDVDHVTAAESRPDFSYWVEQAGQSAAFYDPCLGSIWLLDGTRIFGPGPRGLDSFDVQAHEDGSATIDLRRIHVGTCSSGIHFSSPPPHYCSTPEQPLYDDRAPPNGPDAPGFPF